MSNKFAIQLRATLRPTHSSPEAEMVIKGHHPVIVITPVVEKDSSPDVMTVDVDSTGFEVGQLAAMLHALADTLLDGVQHEVKTSTPPSEFDWDSLTSAHLTDEEKAAGLDGK